MLVGHGKENKLSRGSAVLIAEIDGPLVVAKRKQKIRAPRKTTPLIAKQAWTPVHMKHSRWTRKCRIWAGIGTAMILSSDDLWTQDGASATLSGFTTVLTVRKVAILYAQKTIAGVTPSRCEFLGRLM
jgi:hypothetical protein